MAALRLNPNDANTHYSLGVVLKKKGDLEGAVRSFLAALRLNPNDASAHNNLRIVLKKKRNITQSAP